MKTNKYKIILTLSFLSLFCCYPYLYGETNTHSANAAKHERNYIKEGNRFYFEKRYAEAEVQFRKALEEVPNSEVALFNLAASLIRQTGSTDPNNGSTPVASASQILQRLASEGYNVDLSEKSFYNLGNISFNQQDYKSSVEMYKNALRKDPSDDKARQNLRIAQKKLEEQQQNQQNDQNQQKQDQDQQKDQQQNQQQNPENQQNKNDENKEDKKPQQDKQDKKDQQQQQDLQSISDANAEKILKAMENEEAATRKRVEAQKKKEAAARKKQITNPW